MQRPEVVYRVAEALVDTWLPSVVEIAMVAPHERQKASAESLLDGENRAPLASYLIMLLSGPNGC